MNHEPKRNVQLKNANAIIPPSVTGCFLTKSKTVVLLRLLPEMFSQKLFFFVIDIETLICKQRPIGHLSMLNSMLLHKSVSC